MNLADRSLLSLAEAVAYAGVSPSALAAGAVPVLVPDPWVPAGSLVDRRAVDAWWRQQVLARPAS